MYEITPGWEEYYTTLEMSERKEIFERLIQELPDDGANELRKKMFTNRYPGAGKRGSIVDKYLSFMVFFPGLYERRASIFTRLDKEMEKACETLCLNGSDSYNEAEKAALYLEIRNMADLYFWTCKDGSYGNKIFGVMVSSDEDKVKKACAEAWVCSVGILKASKMEERMKVFSDAVKDAYFAYHKKARVIFETYDAEQRERMLKGKKW